MNHRPTPEIIAHRGFSAQAPENTLSAMEAALEAGAESVEFDLHIAACGTPVVFHDSMLGRTTNGVGPIQRRPVTQLKALDAGSWFGPEFTGERIPTQEELLANLKGRVYRVYQDIKGYREIGDMDRMVAITRQTGMDDVTVFVSGNWMVLNRLRELAPEIQRAYLVETQADFPEALDRAVVDEGSLLDVEIGVSLANPQGVLEAQDAGVEVMAWTVDHPAQASAAFELGLSRLTTREVELLLAWRMGLT